MAPQITGVSIAYSLVYWGADQRKHQNPAAQAFLGGIHRWNPARRASNAENVSIDDVIMWHHNTDT